MWNTVSEFRDKTKISVLSDEEISYFLNVGKRDVINHIFIERKNKYTTNGKRIKLDMYGLHLADSFSYDGSVDISDIRVYELNRTNYEETDLTENITVFKPKYGYIEFDAEYPTLGSNELYVEYYLCRFTFEEMYDQLKLLQRLFALRNMLMEKPMAASALMSANWSMNNVSFDSQGGTLNTLYENITIAINKLIFDLQPLDISSRDIVVNDNPFMFRRF